MAEIIKLAWEKGSAGRYFSTNIPFGSYSIEQHAQNKRWSWNGTSLNPGYYGDDAPSFGYSAFVFTTPEEAQAAAQADFDQRVNVCLVKEVPNDGSR